MTIKRVDRSVIYSKMLIGMGGVCHIKSQYCGGSVHITVYTYHGMFKATTFNNQPTMVHTVHWRVIKGDLNATINELEQAIW